MMSVSEIIALWPSAEILSDDLGLKHRSYARLMKRRGRIPEVHWPALVSAAARRGIEGLSYDVLVAAHAGGPLANDDMAASSVAEAKGEHNLGCNNHKRAVNF